MIMLRLHQVYLGRNYFIIKDVINRLVPKSVSDGLDRQNLRLCQSPEMNIGQSLNPSSA